MAFLAIVVLGTLETILIEGVRVVILALQLVIRALGWVLGSVLSILALVGLVVSTIRRDEREQSMYLDYLDKFWRSTPQTDD